MDEMSEKRSESRSEIALAHDQGNTTPASAAALVYGYDPPRKADDPRICSRCLSRTGSWSGHQSWPIQNAKTDIYHSGGDYGITDCGIDATGDHFRWPI